MKRKAEDLVCGHGTSWVRGQVIGKGSFGSVFLATSKNPGSRFSCFPSPMAVKSAKVSGSASLQKEKEVLDKVKGCPFVIDCFGEEITTQEDGEMVYNLLLEYASGGTLADSIKKSGGCGLPESDVKRYTKSILKGLRHIHDCGYVHCDLKPENVLLVPSINSSGNFVAKIGDFGLSKRSAQSKKRRFDLDLYLRGTPPYLAPETVIENVQELPSDIWAMGCVVCEMLTGKSPWDRAEELNTKDLLRLIGDQRELPKIPSGISEDARGFLKACLVRKPMFRFTVEMLMDHTFLAGVGEHDDEGLLDVHDDEERGEGLLDIHDEEPLAASSSSSTETDAELSGSSFSGDWSLVSDDDDDGIDSASCSWPEEVEDVEVQFIGSSDKEVSLLGSLNCITQPYILEYSSDYTR
ncbi:mitogen-activated protein kinase kinase kinase 20-like [Corylus avellana]|uniref:mitogen-activated protein kinase kinase kinase 20-like n=1 Tax=Corylus avellana TaxID=13451 RepID=UPI001E208CF3|nr:mitogen-activated protein kinase kinase kinase 20-like [Corylus avellana]